MKQKRNIYLKMHSLQKAKEIMFSNFSLNFFKKKEIVPSHMAIGRILAKPVVAKYSSPHYNSAAMDGFAVKAEDTFNSSEQNPKKLILNKSAQYINTGQPIPKEFNAVIMIEKVQILEKNIIKIEAPVFPWQNIRKIGEDIVSSELLYSRNHQISPYCVGALISSGIFTVSVRKKPKILIIPTGSELIDFNKKKSEKLNNGQIFEFNSYVLGGMIEACGATYKRLDITPDDYKTIKKVILESINKDFDMILTIGGSSAGSKDYAKNVVEKIGKILVHGVSIMPGKPIIIADIKSKPFFGIPGYPISAIIAFEQFVSPLIRQMLHMPKINKDIIKAIPSRKITSKLGVEEFLRVKLCKIDNNIIASPLSRGAGTITSITEADGILRIKAQNEGINNNKSVKIELLKHINSINNNIIAVGSHDNSINILADELKKRDSNFTLTSSNVGSIGGLMAIKNNICHIAGIHLLDEKSKTYNIPYIKKYLKDIDVILINLAMREQGFIIPKGNPKKIEKLEDLNNKKITIVNRQKGSGTRILLDFKLSEVGILGKEIIGYKREEYTHMDLALAISTGSADVGIGIFAAAKALNLDFIPITTEKYDLVIRKKNYESDSIKLLIKIINSEKFKERISFLGGYNTKHTGSRIM